MLIAHYKAIAQKSLSAVDQIGDDPESLALLSKVHNYALDFEKLAAAIDSRPESEIFCLAVNEFNFALYAAASARYRHATISLRLFFELAAASIHFSAHEINLRKWLNNTGDINWSALTNDEKGLFAKPFVEVFHPGMDTSAKQYAAIAGKVYRECSEHVHGNINTHESSADPLFFNKTAFFEWTERAESVRLCIIFAFAARYLNFLPNDKIQMIEHIILEDLGHIQSVRNIYSK